MPRDHGTRKQSVRTWRDPKRSPSFKRKCLRLGQTGFPGTPRRPFENRWLVGAGLNSDIAISGVRAIGSLGPEAGVMGGGVFPTASRPNAGLTRDTDGSRAYREPGVPPHQDPWSSLGLAGCGSAPLREQAMPAGRVPHHRAFPAAAKRDSRTGPWGGSGLARHVEPIAGEFARRPPFWRRCEGRNSPNSGASRGYDVQPLAAPLIARSRMPTYLLPVRPCCRSWSGRLPLAGIRSALLQVGSGSVGAESMT